MRLRAVATSHCDFSKFIRRYNAVSSTNSLILISCQSSIICSGPVWGVCLEAGPLLVCASAFSWTRGQLCAFKRPNLLSIRPSRQSRCKRCIQESKSVLRSRLEKVKHGENLGEVSFTFCTFRERCYIFFCITGTASEQVSRAWHDNVTTTTRSRWRKFVLAPATS